MFSRVKEALGVALHKTLEGIGPGTLGGKGNSGVRRTKKNKFTMIKRYLTTAKNKTTTKKSKLSMKKTKFTTEKTKLNEKNKLRRTKKVKKFITKKKT